MKAKLRPRIDLENRTPLETVIPLSVPFVIFVDPCDTCNFQCRFCPTGDRLLMRKTRGRGHGPMDFDLFKKIINDISEFEKPIKVLRLYKDGEPLLNPMFAEMVEYARKKNCAERIDTTTNGTLLNKKMIPRIIDAGIDRINISIIGLDSKRYINFSKYKIDFERFVDTLRLLYENRKQCEIIIKINGDIISEAEKGEFLEIFGEIADGVYIEHIIDCWPNFNLKGVEANSKVGIYGQPLTSVSVCPYVFYSFSLNSDGTASLCFLDWARRLIIGDSKKQKVKDIWNSSILFEYQKMFLMKKRQEHPICANCSQLTHGMPDNIDMHAQMLLNRLIEYRTLS